MSEQDFPQAAADFDLTNDTIRAARSIVGLYNLPTNGKTVEDKITLIIQSKKAEIADMLQKQTDIIVALTKGCGTCKFITSDSEVPQGCGSEVVTTDVTVHIPVQVCPLALSTWFAKLMNRDESMLLPKSVNSRRNNPWQNRTRPSSSRRLSSLVMKRQPRMRSGSRIKRG